MRLLDAIRKTVSWRPYSEISKIRKFSATLNPKQPCLNLNCRGHILLVNSPHSRKVNGLVPCIQNGYHLAYAPEIAFEDCLKAVTTTAGLFHDDSELIVDEETHEKVARTNQVVPEHLQSTAHLVQQMLQHKSNNERKCRWSCVFAGEPSAEIARVDLHM